MAPLYMGDRGMGRLGLGLMNTSSISGMSCRLALVDDEAREYFDISSSKDRKELSIPVALELLDPEPIVFEDLDLIDPTSSESAVVSTIRGCFTLA